MKQIDPEVLAGFIEEARSYLPQIRAGIADFRRRPDDGEAVLAEPHRLVHSIKGAASMVGLATLGHLAFYFEEALEELAAGGLEAGAEAFGALDSGLTQIEAYLDGVATGRLRQRPLVEEVVRRFRRLRKLPELGDGEEIERLLADSRSPAAPPAPRPPGSGSGAPQPAPFEEPEEVAPELVEAFHDEAEEHLAAIDAALAALAAKPGERGHLQQVRRSVHTLKGAASLVGQGAVGRLAHRMEDLLDRLYEGGDEVPTPTLELLYATHDALSDLLSGDVGDEALRAGLDELYERYRTVLGDEEEGELEAPPLPAGLGDLGALGEEPSIDLAALGAGRGEAGRSVARSLARTQARGGPVVRVPLERLEELVRLVSELVVNRASFEQHFGDLRREVGELAPSMERLRRIASRLESEYEVATLAVGRAAPLRAVAGGGGAAGAAVLDFDELELDRYTDFHVVSRELTETGSDIAAVGNELGATIGDFDGYLGRLGRLTSEMQDRLMRLRMVPVATLATRLHRAVRVTAAQQGKSVELVIEGREVELDKTVLEELADPLLHLMRNAVDHGIEPPELRQVLGKPKTGRIVLRAFHEGTQIGIRVADDGAGIEPEMVRSAVVAGGFLSEPEAAELATEELLAMLFLPGFTTAGEVSEVSGRGVGLDVVKATVEKMKGTVGLASTVGGGTTVSIRLPMTMAIIRVLMVTAAHQTFAVPLAAVGQILRVDRREIDRVGREPVIESGGEVYPLIHLGAALGLPEPPGAEPPERSPVLVLDLGERRHALAVDTLVEAREVVVKPLGSHLRRVRGITGATVMGDGGVVLILNPAELAAVPAGAALRGAAASVAPRLARQRAAATLDVLIVDDSLSVRRVLSKLARTAGWNPSTARDGVEALEVLQRAARLPDVILLDLEMPRMDGYELAAALKAQEPLAGIPIVVLTSRAGGKHRERAFELGVDEYLVKPYQDEVLIAAIRRVARTRGEAAPA